MGALSADFRAAHSALLSDGLSIARVGSDRVSRFGLAPSRPLPLLRSRCHGIADRFRCLGPQPETAPGFDRDHASMPVCPRYLSLAVSSAWRTQLDNECGKAPAQRVRFLRYSAPACRQRAFLHVR